MGLLHEPAVFTGQVHPFDERHARALSDDEVVEDLDVDEGEGGGELLGEDAVDVAGLGDPGRVFVREDNGARVVVQGTAHDDAGVDDGSVEGSVGKVFVGEHSVAGVEEQGREDFDRVVAKAGGEEPGHGRGRVEWTPSVEVAREVPASEFEGGGDRDRLVLAESFEGGEVLGREVEQVPEASRLEDRVVGALGGLHGREVGEEQAHELAVGERGCAVSNEVVGRAFGTGAVRKAQDVI